MRCGLQGRVGRNSSDTRGIAPLLRQAYGLANPTVFATEAVQTMMGLTEGEYKGKIVIILGA